MYLEPTGLFSQLLEAVNDPNPEDTMDQIREANEMAITLLANASNKLLLMRRASILEGACYICCRKNWATVAPRLFGLKFLQEAADHLSAGLENNRSHSRIFNSPPS